MLERLPAALRLRRMGPLALVAAFLAGLPGSAEAQQGIDCSRLQAQIASMGTGDPTLAARYGDAARKQQYELERTQTYAQSIGCSNRQFLFFGSAPPPQCGGLEAQIQRMKGNLATLQGQVRNAADGGRSELIGRYNAACRGGGQRQQGGVLDSLFGGDRNQQQPLDDFPPVDDTPRGGSKAVCVRTCDGGFFPVSYSARNTGLGSLEELCHALCPNAETRLFTYSPTGEIEQAVGADGSTYKSMPNALKYRTKFDPTCTCKPANKSWVQALADAETLLGRTKSDIIVTPERAEEMSRAKGASTAKIPAVKPPAAKGPENDPAIAQEAAANAQSPTASNASAGIATNANRAPKTYGLKDGQMREDTTADGVKRKVRVIGPTL